MALRRTLEQRHPDYHNAPVLPRGPLRARYLIVGLAPGLHGANRTGRPFVGDASGRFLAAALERTGIGGVRVTNVVACLPPDNRPIASELANCAPWLRADLAAHLGRRRRVGILTLGRVAHAQVVRVLGVDARAHAFEHGRAFRLGHAHWVCSYHPSRQNVNTGRLTEEQFDRALLRLRDLVTSRVR